MKKAYVKFGCLNPSPVFFEQLIEAELIASFRARLSMNQAWDGCLRCSLSQAGTLNDPYIVTTSAKFVVIISK